MSQQEFLEWMDQKKEIVKAAEAVIPKNACPNCFSKAIRYKDGKKVCGSCGIAR